MSSITAGNTVYQVTVDEIIPSRAIANCLVPGTSSKLPVPLIPMRSRMPQVGEVWLIDKQFGNWSFAALIQSPNIFTGSSAVHGTGSPVGVVTPIGIGQNYIDDAKTGGVSQWIATGTTSQDWSVLGGDVGQLSQQVTTLQTTLTQTSASVTANQQALDSATQTLNDTTTSLTQAQADIAASQQQLANNNAALATAQDTLATTTTELAQTQSDLDAAQAQLDAANAAIAANTTTLTTATETLSTAQDNIASAQATLAQHAHDLYDPSGVLQTSEDVLAGNITTAQNAADAAQATATAAQQAANDASGAAALATTAAQNAASLADGKAVVFVQTAAPTAGMSLNDLWVNTSDGNAVYIYTGSPLAWGKYQDQSIGTALDNAAIANNIAAGAQATADRKITTYYDGPSRTNLAPTPSNGGTSTNSAKYPISLDAATVHYSSGGSIKATPSSPAAGDPTVASLTGLGGLTPIPYTPSATYTVSYWVLASSVANLSATATITATPSGGSAVVTPGTAMTITANDIEWTQVSVTATMPATAGSWVPGAVVARAVGNAVTADTVWITDVLIEKSATVGSFITGTSVEPTPPTGGFTLGDLWVNTSSGNHLWRWDGTQWESAQDSAIEAAQAAADAASNSAATAITSAQTAQSTADGKAVVFYQAAAPTTGMSLNDIWINSASGNVVNRYNGTAWVLAQDQSIGTALTNAATANNIATGAQATADRKITTYYATSTPTAPTGGFTVGDLWVDEADDNHLFRWDGTQWGDARDKTIAAAQAAADSAATSASNALTSAQNAASLADGKAVVFFQGTAPTAGMSLNDIWIDSSNGNLVHIYSGTAWTVAQDQAIGTALASAATANNLASGAQATADRKITTYYASGTPPTPSGGFTIGDMWVDEGDQNHLWRWSGTAWVDVRDATIAEAQAKADAAANTAANAVASAQTAQSTADGKAVLFYQPTTPSGDLNDMWLDTGHGNIVKICTNPPTGWTAAQDQSIATALTNAQTANNLAAGAQATANLKITTYFNGPGRTNLAPSPATGGGTNNGADWTISVDASTTHFESAGSLKSVPKTTTLAAILSNYGCGGMGTGTTYVAGATYTFSAWVRASCPAATNAYLKMAYTPSGGALATVTGTVVSIPANATDWYQISVTATMPATAGTYYPIAYVNRVSGNAALTDAAWITDQMMEASATVGSFIVGTDTPPSPPDGGFTIGDMWINTTDKNHPYRWDGQQWDDVRDATIADAQAKADAAATTASTAVTSAQTAQSTADGKAVIFFQKTAPTGETASDINDIWIDSSNGNRVNLWSGTAWVVAQDQSIGTALANAATATNLANGAQATANLKTTTYYTTTSAQSGISHGPTAPTGGFTTGDLWVDEYDKNHPYRWSGTAWTDVRDATIAAAQAAANAAAAQAGTAITSAQTAQSTADGKAQVFFSSTAPTGEAASDVNDIWIDSSNGNRVNLWSGTAWVVAQDQSISTALTNAAAANTAASGAQSTANAANTAATTAQNAANAAQAAANTANSAALTAAGIASTKGQVFFGTAAPTVLQRVNLCTNPTFGAATTGWGMYGGVGGAASLTRQSGTDTPRGTAGYGRMTWTAASTNGGGIVWGSPGSSTGAPVSANTTYTFSAWIRSSKAISITPQVQFYNGATATIDQGGVATALAANTWTRVSFTTTSGANDTLGQPRFYAAAGTTFAVGATLDLDDALIEASSILGSYFDGAAASPDPSLINAWTGTANASTSGQYSNVTLWIDTTSGNNTPKKFTPPATWTAITDAAATNAATAAGNAQNTANSANTLAGTANTAAQAAQATANYKITTYYVASPATPVPPSGGFTAGDLWIDTGNHSQVNRWSGTAWVLTDLASQSYISSRGTDLVTNGTGYLGTNYNFSGFTFTSADSPPGSSGSFLMTTSGYLGSKFSDELIPVNTGKSYVLSAWARETASAGASYFYAGFACYDSFKQSIAPSHYVYTAGTDTTLAADLKPGDTTVTLTSAAGWRTTSPYNYLTVWNYVDPGGQVWPQHTYSRWSATFTAISTNTLTLSAAWPAAWGTIPAGTPVSNGQSGGTYQYAVASHATAPTTWTQFTSVAITGTADGTKGTATTSFVPGTANIKFLFLPQYTGTATDARQAFGGISMSDAAAAQLAATNAQATASGKNTTYWGTVAASGTTPGLKVNDVYYQYSLVSGKFSIIAMWQWNGTAWQTAALNETFLPQVNIGTGTYGTLDGGRLTATSVTATQIAGNTITATQIKGGTITSNEINAQSVAGAVGTFISLDVGQLTATGTSTLATAVIQKISANVLVANSITATQITSGAVTGDKVDATTVAAKIGSFLSIDVGQLTATGTSTLATAVIQKISAGVLVANSITSAQIVSGSITGDRLNANTINAAIGSFLTIDVAQLTATGTSHFATIVANQMFTDIFSANKITAAQIQANTITATQIYGGTITATQINASSVAAAVGTFVQVKAENIQAGTVTSNLVMGATLTGGTTGGARVDIGTLGTGITGLRQYDANNNVIVDMTNGSATFTGAISGGSASFPAGAGVSGGGFYADQSNMQYGVDTTTNLCPNPAVASLTGVTAIGSGTNIAVGQAPSQNSWTNWDYGGPNMLSTALKVWNTTLASGTASVVLGAAQPSTQYTVSFYSAIGMVDGSTPGNQELDVLWANLKVTRADTAAVVAATPTGYGAIGGNLPGLWSPMAAGGLQGSSGLSNGAANIGMGGWSYRWFFTFTTPSNLPANTNLLLNLPVATTKAGAATATLAAFYGAFQMEAKPGMTRYCDGNQASCLWSGTANASTSVRNGFSGLYTGSWTDPRVIGTLQTDYLKSSKMKLGSGSLRGTNYTQVWQPSSWTLLQNGGYHTLTYSASNTSRISNDDGAIFDGASTFTAPVAGIYAYSTMASLTSLPTAGANDLILMDCMTSSGAVVNRCMWSRTYLATQNVSVTGLVWANAGDSFYFRIWQNLAGSSTLSGNASGTPNLAYFALIA